MGWKAQRSQAATMLSSSRNPLSLDMGWKEALKTSWKLPTLSQSAFAGYGLKRGDQSPKKQNNNVAIRFRWIWVEKIHTQFGAGMFLVVAIRFRWIWVEKESQILHSGQSWVAIRFRWIWVEKLQRMQAQVTLTAVAIRFRWIWVEKSTSTWPCYR